jgi:hypothetical protein
MHREFCQDVPGRIGDHALLAPWICPIQLSIVIHVSLLVLALDFVQGWLRDVDVTAFDQLSHLPEKEC